MTGLYVAGRALAARRPQELLALAPFAVVLVHLLWRHDVYGYWLPNTYYAKHVAPWPRMGALYVASFVVEFAYWPQVLLLLLAPAVALYRRARPPVLHPATLVSLTVAMHWAYYTFVIGGDHFEYRVYQHLVPVLALMSPVLAGFLGGAPRRWLAAFAAFWAFGLVVPWSHYSYTWNWAETHSEIRQRKGAFLFRMKDRLWPIGPYVAVWDDLQTTMQRQFACLRWHGHRTFLFYQIDRWHMVDHGPLPDLGGDLGVLAYTSIGWPAWKYPDWALIDLRGLNDVAVAHMPPVSSGADERLMAHDRLASPAYTRCFRPNLVYTDDGVVFEPRQRPLTADEVQACERRFGPEGH
jgi:arabinofuranosyltransferase